MQLTDHIRVIDTFIKETGMVKGSVSPDMALLSLDTIRQMCQSVKDELRVLRGIAEGSDYAELFKSASKDALIIEAALRKKRASMSVGKQVPLNYLDIKHDSTVLVSVDIAGVWTFYPHDKVIKFYIGKPKF